MDATRIALAAGLLLLTTPAWAGDDLTGRFRLEGKDNYAHPITVDLHVEVRQGGLCVSRTATDAKCRKHDHPRTWVSTNVRVHGRLAYVVFEVERPDPRSEQGLIKKLELGEPLESAREEFVSRYTAVYRLSADGRSISELIVRHFGSVTVTCWSYVKAKGLRGGGPKAKAQAKAQDPPGKLKPASKETDGKSWTLGSSKAEVRELQGAPDTIIGSSARETWFYGSASVVFRDGRAHSYSNSEGRLKVRLAPGSNVTATSWTQGSHRDEVLAVQGTPDTVIRSSTSRETFYYGRAKVSFKSDKVTTYGNRDRRLKVH